MTWLHGLLAILGLGLLGTTHAAPPGEAGASAGPRRIYVVDVRRLKQVDLSNPAGAAAVWDTMHALAALQGIVNRDQPRLYLIYCSGFGVETDQFWLDWLRGEDGWLRAAEVIPLNGLEDALQVFRREVRGTVIYDEATPSTSNLASTAAGCRNLLPLRFSRDTNSWFAKLAGTPGLEPRLWLVRTNGSPLFTGEGLIPGTKQPSTGSAKCDAYLWAIKNFLEPGQCAPGFAAYYLDAFWIKHPRQGPADLHTLSNHDYFIAKRAFFFDLSPWGDEAPNDDPAQPSGADRRAFLAVMSALHDLAGDQIIKVGGFTPWPYKYTDFFGGGKHGGVPTEWEFGRLISQYNGYMEADAAGAGGMANASFFRHYPLHAEYRQPNRKPGPAEYRRSGHLDAAGQVKPRLYVGHYVGDYDAPSWLYKAVPAFFQDSSRGRVPLAWAFNPNLADRCPQVFAYVYRRATSNDFFIAGDSGAGYLNPRGLTVRPDSGFPSGLKVWAGHCADYYRRWDMSITGFVLDGASGASTELEFEAYRTFSPDGCGTHYEKTARMIAGVPTCPELDLPGSAEKSAEVILQRARGIEGKPDFLWARSILKPPDWYAALSRHIQEKEPDAPVVVVDPYTFFGLIKVQAAQVGR